MDKGNLCNKGRVHKTGVLCPFYYGKRACGFLQLVKQNILTRMRDESIIQAVGDAQPY